jgi:hypothetical protein
MQMPTSPAELAGWATAERLFHGVDRAFWTCAATGWTAASRKTLRKELLALRGNLVRYTAASRNDARRLDPQSIADGIPQGGDGWEAERRISVPYVLAARLAACGEDREEMYRIRDEFEHFQRDLHELEDAENLFPVDPRSEAGEGLAPGATERRRYLRKLKLPRLF